MLGSAFWAYGLPLLLLMAGALLGSIVAAPLHRELFSLLGAVLGFLLSFLVLRLRNEKAKVLQPSIVEILPKTIKLKNCSSS